jgi:hypothetical protein
MACQRFTQYAHARSSHGPSLKLYFLVVILASGYAYGGDEAVYIALVSGILICFTLFTVSVASVRERRFR